MEWTDQPLLPASSPQSMSFSQDYGLLEDFPFSDYMHLPLAFSYHENAYFANQETQQHHDHPTLTRQEGFSASQTSFSAGQSPGTAATQLLQFLITDEADSVPAQPMAPPSLRKRKAPTLGADKWQPVKARVIELYTSQNLPLPEVKRIVEEEFKSSGFTAT